MLMKTSITLALTIALLGSACAPVATSVPKLNRTTPREADSILAEVGGRIRVVGSVSIQSEDEAVEYASKLKESGYSITKKNEYGENDRKFSDLKELDLMNEIELPLSIIRADVVVVFVVKKKAKGVSDKLSNELKLEWERNNKNEVSFKVNRDGASAEAWPKVKAALVSVIIASREVLTQ
jgi:hypothetical protein